MHYFIGQIAAVGTAVCWSICGPCFTLAGRRIGSLAVNFHRLVLAGIFLAILGLSTSGQAIPLDASAEAWWWLGASGLIGFFLCDLCLFRSFLLIGPRIALLIMSLAPATAALIDWIFLGETLGIWSIVGMTVTLAGVALVVADRHDGPIKTTPPTDDDADPNYIEVDTAASSLTATPPTEKEKSDAENHTHTSLSTIDPRQRTIGLILTIIATATQAIGLVFADIGMKTDRNEVSIATPDNVSPDAANIKTSLLKSEIENSSKVADARSHSGSIDNRTAEYHKGIGPFAATQIRLVIGLIGFLIMITATRRWRPVMHGLTNGRAMLWLTLGTISGPFLGVSLGLLSLQHIPTGPAMTLMSLTPLLMLPVTKYLLDDHISYRAAIGAGMAVVGAAILFMF